MCNFHIYIYIYIYIKHVKKKKFKGHVTHIIPISMTFFSFSFKTILFCYLFFFLFSLLYFDIYSLFLHFGTLQVFWKHKLGTSAIGKIEKTAFTAEFFTVANTLKVGYSDLKKRKAKQRQKQTNRTTGTTTKNKQKQMSSVYINTGIE